MFVGDTAADAAVFMREAHLKGLKTQAIYLDSTGASL
jgi:hypothetical protein